MSSDEDDTDMSKRVQLNTPAPDFCLIDFTGQQVCLAHYRQRRRVVLVFNRGFQ